MIIVGDYVYRIANDIPSFEEAWKFLLSKNEFVEDEIDKWAEQIFEKEDLAFMDAYTKAFEETQVHYNEMYYHPAVAEATGGITGEDIHRVIELPEGTNPVTLENLGIYWAYDPAGAASYWGEQTGEDYMFRARADAEHVNVRELVLARMINPNEDEITYLPDSPIFVYDVELPDATVLPINDWRRT